MTDEDERIINRAIVLVEDQDARENARAALHSIFRRTRKLENEVERLQEAAVQLTMIADEVQVERDSFGHQLARANAKVENLRGTIQGLRRMVEEYEAEVERLQEKYEREAKAYSRLMDKARPLEAEVKRLRNDESHLRLQLADAERDVERLRGERDRYERTLRWYATNAPDSVAQHVLNGESLFNAAQGGEPDA